MHLLISFDKNSIFCSRCIKRPAVSQIKMYDDFYSTQQQQQQEVDEQIPDLPLRSLIISSNFYNRYKTFYIEFIYVLKIEWISMTKETQAIIIQCQMIFCHSLKWECKNKQESKHVRCPYCLFDLFYFVCMCVCG